MKNRGIIFFLLVALHPCLVFAWVPFQDAGDSSKNAVLVDSLVQSAFSRKNLNISEALQMLETAKLSAQKINYQQGLSAALYTEAGIYQQSGFDKRAHVLYELASEISNRQKDTFNIIRINQQLATMLAVEGKADQAIGLLDTSLQLSMRKGLKKEIANIKNSEGLIELKRNNTGRAESLFKDALQVSLDEKFIYGQKKAFYNLGLLFRAKKDTSTARSYFLHSISLDHLLNDHYGLALNQIQLSEMLFDAHRIIDGMIQIREGYQHASTVSAYDLMNKCCQLLLGQYRQRNDVSNIIQWQDSLIHILKLKADNDFQYAVNYIDLVKDKESQKFTAKSEIDKANKRADSQLLIIIVGTILLIVLALMVIIIFFSYRKHLLLSRKLSRQNAIIEENAASLDQLNKEINSKNQLLEEDNRTKDKLLSIISHDLRNPITNTQTILSLINNGALEEEESKVLLEQLEMQYINTTGLLDNLLSWLKSQITGTVLEKTEINVHELMNAMHLEQKLALVKKRIRFLNNTPNDCRILGEKDMVKIIFRNLISNAVKFTPLDGKVEVMCESGDGFDEVIIKDSGIGMSEEVLAKVNAQKYFTRTGTLQEKGSGFGLILCRDLLQKMGGTLSIETAKGEGSIFTVRLPKPTMDQSSLEPAENI